jgi:hypothetical protein
VRAKGNPLLGNYGVFYFLTDHLGSTTVTVNSAGSLVGELRYREASRSGTCTCMQTCAGAARPPAQDRRCWEHSAGECR